MARPRLISDQQILGTMREAVLERGPSVSLEVVADRLGGTSPALLKRFGNREELLLRALRPSDEPSWMRVLEAGPDDRPLAAQLEELVAAVAEYFDEVIPCFMALRESGIPHARIHGTDKVPGPLRGLRAVSRWLDRARAAGLVGPQASETAATALLGAVQARAFMAHLMHRPGSPRAHRAFARELAQLFARMLEPDGAGRAPSRRSS